MAQELTLEQELIARIFVHKFAVASGVLMKKYLQENSKEGEVNLFEPVLEQQADEYSNKIVQKALEEGTFDELYNNAWDIIKDTMPEHTKVM